MEYFDIQRRVLEGDSLVVQNINVPNRLEH
jgi:hypothetical protein